MSFEPSTAIIEYYGPLIRVGIEGKWVEFIARPKVRPPRKELLELIEQMGRERTQ
jgi:hypothetical protein